VVGLRPPENVAVLAVDLHGHNDVRHKAVTGFMVAKPEPQFDSIGNPPHQSMNTAAAIVTAAKPAA
jgi:hypothetical protein